MDRAAVRVGLGRITGLTIVEMTSPIAPGTTVTEAYYKWSEDDWDLGSRYATLTVDDRPATSGQANLSILLSLPGEPTLISIIVSAQDATTRTKYTITVTHPATALLIRSKLSLEVPLP